MNNIFKHLSIIALLSLHSCGTETASVDTNATGSPETSTNGGSDEGSLATPESRQADLEKDRQIEKINFLVDNYNSVSIPSYDDYGDYIDAYGDNPSKFVNKGSYSSNTMSEELLNDLTKAMEIDALNELNPLIKKFQTNGLALAKLINELDKYHEMKDYEIDNLAKGKKMHQSVIQAYHAFFEIDNELQYQSGLIQQDMELKRLKLLKESGDTYNYLVGMSILTSRKMINEAQKDDMLKLDANQLKEINSEIRDIYDEFTKFKDDNPDHAQVKDFNFSNFYRTLKEFTITSQEVFIRVRDKRRLSTGEKMMLNAGSGWMNEGTPEDLLRKFNKLVDAYNRMY